MALLSNLNASLIDLYSNGMIKLESDPDFGKGVEWESLFYDGKKDIVIVAYFALCQHTNLKIIIY